jgi:hypothetical protein
VVHEAPLYRGIRVLPGRQQFRGAHDGHDGRPELVGGVGQEPLLIDLQLVPCRKVLDHHQHFATTLFELDQTLQPDPKKGLPIAHPSLYTFPALGAVGDCLLQTKSLPGIRQLVEWLLAGHAQHGARGGIHEHNMPLRISYQHAFGEVVQYGVERCFALAQRLLGQLAFGDVFVCDHGS